MIESVRKLDELWKDDAVPMERRLKNNNKRREKERKKEAVILHEMKEKKKKKKKSAEECRHVTIASNSDPYWATSREELHYMMHISSLSLYVLNYKKRKKIENVYT